MPRKSLKLVRFGRLIDRGLMITGHFYNSFENWIKSDVEHDSPTYAPGHTTALVTDSTAHLCTRRKGLEKRYLK